MSKKTAIQYNSEIFELVQSLVPINNSIIFEKSPDGEKVMVRRADSEMSVAYILDAPSTYFDFPVDKLAFYNYNEFYQFFGTYSEPKIDLNDIKVTLSEGNAKTDYIISNPEMLPAGPKTINFKDPSISFKLTAEDIDKISKMNTLIKAKRARLIGNKDAITIKLFSSMHDNAYENEWEVEALNDFDGEFDFVIFSELFVKLPPKKDYNVEIISTGWVRVSLVDETFNLDIYTGCVNS